MLNERDLAARLPAPRPWRLSRALVCRDLSRHLLNPAVDVVDGPRQAELNLGGVPSGPLGARCRSASSSSDAREAPRWIPRRPVQREPLGTTAAEGSLDHEDVVFGTELVRDAPRGRRVVRPLPVPSSRYWYSPGASKTEADHAPPVRRLRTTPSVDHPVKSPVAMTDPASPTGANSSRGAPRACGAKCSWNSWRP